MRKAALMLSFLLIFATIFSPLTASAAYEITDFEVVSKAALLVSLDTGETMYSKNADEKRFPASLTKVMTAIVVLDNCDDIDKKITVPEYCITILSGSGTTVGNLKAGENVTIRDLLHLMLICSAADAANTLADYVGAGSIDSFVDKMNKKAAELEMNASHFENPHGLHDDNHYSTVNDLYKMAKYATKQPVIMEICSKSRYTVSATNKNESRVISTTNMLIDSNTGYYYKYARGIKTGFTTPAGRCLITTASRNGYNYICIILGGDDDTRSEYTDSKKLYNWVFTNFEYRKIADKNTMIEEMGVELAWDTDFIQLYPENDLSAIVPANIDNSSLIFDVVLKDTTVWAPVKKGNVMGYARVTCAGAEIAQVNLVAGENISRNQLLFVKKLFDIIIQSPVFLLLAGVLGVLLFALIVVNIIHNKRKRNQVKRVKHIRKF